MVGRKSYGSRLIAGLIAAALAAAPCAAYADAQGTAFSCGEAAETAKDLSSAYYQDTVYLQNKSYDSPIIVSSTVKEYSVAKDGETYLSANFQVKEFASHDGADLVYIDSELVKVLQQIRDHFNAPVTISSGYRSPEHNAEVGGVDNSYHTKGMAADIVVEGHETLEVAQYAETIGVHGIGCYSTWVHVETRITNTYYWDADGNEVKSFFDLPDETEDVPGDVDDNGEVEALDSLLVLQYVVSLRELDEEQISRADLDGDGEATAADALLILRKVVHIDD